MIIIIDNDQVKKNSLRLRFTNLPSKRSIVTSSTNISHQRKCFGCLPTQSTTSNLLSFPAKYIRATAIISGSHCSDRVVHKLQENINHDQINFYHVKYQNIE